MRTESKRESEPSAEMRAKRYDPTFFASCQRSGTGGGSGRGERGKGGRKEGRKGRRRTSGGPDPHRGTKHHLPPVQAGARHAAQSTDNAGPGGFEGADAGGGIAGSEGGEVERERCAGEVGEGAGEVVEALGLGEDGGDGDGALEGVG